MLVEMKDTKDGRRLVGSAEVQEYLDMGWTLVDVPKEEKESAPADYNFLEHSLEELQEMAIEAELDVEPEWKRSDYAEALNASSWRPE